MAPARYLQRAQLERGAGVPVVVGDLQRSRHGQQAGRGWRQSPLCHSRPGWATAVPPGACCASQAPGIRQSSSCPARLRSCTPSAERSKGRHRLAAPELCAHALPPCHCHCRCHSVVTATAAGPPTHQALQAVAQRGLDLAGRLALRPRRCRLGPVLADPLQAVQQAEERLRLGRQLRGGVVAARVWGPGWAGRRAGCDGYVCRVAQVSRREKGGIAALLCPMEQAGSLGLYVVNETSPAARRSTAAALRTGPPVRRRPLDGCAHRLERGLGIVAVCPRSVLELSQQHCSSRGSGAAGAGTLASGAAGGYRPSAGSDAGTLVRAPSWSGLLAAAAFQLPRAAAGPARRAAGPGQLAVQLCGRQLPVPGLVLWLKLPGQVLVQQQPSELGHAEGLRGHSRGQAGRPLGQARQRAGCQQGMPAACPPVAPPWTTWRPFGCLQNHHRAQKNGFSGVSGGPRAKSTLPPLGSPTVSLHHPLLQPFAHFWTRAEAGGQERPAHPPRTSWCGICSNMRPLRLTNLKATSLLLLMASKWPNNAWPREAPYPSARPTARRSRPPAAPLPRPPAPGSWVACSRLCPDSARHIADSFQMCLYSVCL